MPTDGAVQSRDHSFWQSTGEAADKHGILIIKHNERWIIAKQEIYSIYFVKVKNKSVNKAIAQDGETPGFLQLCVWGCSVPEERKGSSHPIKQKAGASQPVLNTALSAALAQDFHTEDTPYVPVTLPNYTSS